MSTPSKKWRAGDTYIEHGDCYWRAGIDDLDAPQSSDRVWQSRIECYGRDEKHAAELRDKVLELLSAATIISDLQARIEELEADRVAIVLALMATDEDDLPEDYARWYNRRFLGQTADTSRDHYCEEAWQTALIRAKFIVSKAAFPTPPAPEAEDKVGAAFESWLARVRPSGDVDSVESQWRESSDYAELMDVQDSERDAKELTLLRFELALAMAEGAHPHAKAVAAKVVARVAMQLAGVQVP